MAILPRILVGEKVLRKGNTPPVGRGVSPVSHSSRPILERAAAAVLIGLSTSLYSLLSYTTAALNNPEPIGRRRRRRRRCASDIEDPLGPMNPCPTRHAAFLKAMHCELFRIITCVRGRQKGRLGRYVGKTVAAAAAGSGKNFPGLRRMRANERP